MITGAHSDYCVQTTALSALANGYDIALIKGGHAAEPTIIAGVALAAATASMWLDEVVRGIGDAPLLPLAEIPQSC